MKLSHFQAFARKQRHLRRGFKIAALLSLTPVVSSQAAVYTYTSTPGSTTQADGNGVWNTTTSNWINSSGASSLWGNTFDDTAVFGVGAATTTASTVTVGTVNANAIQFNALGTNGFYTLSGGTITLGTSSAGVTPVLTNNNTGGQDTRNGVGVTISSVLAGTAGLTIAGTGSTSLNGANTFTGGVTLSGGFTRINSNASLGDASNAVTVTANSFLSLNFTTASSLTLARNITVNSGARLSLDSYFNGTVSTLTESGTISGAGKLLLGNTNRESLVILTGTNTLTGGVGVSGTLRATDGTSLPTAANLSLEGLGGAGVSAQGIFETSGAFSRALGTGAGQVQWGGNVAGNNYNIGGFAAVGGTLAVNLGGNATPTALTWGSTTGFNLAELRLQDANSTAALTWANPINLNGSTRIVSVQGAQTATMTGLLSGTNANSALNKDGNGTLILPAANTYTGATIIGIITNNAITTGGTLSTGPNGTLANGGTASAIGASTNAAANLVFNNGTLQYANNTGANASTDRLFQIGTTVAAASATLDASGTGTLTFSNTGAITYGTTAQTRALNFVGSNTGANTFAPLVGDNGTAMTSVAKAGVGTWVLTGNNTYTGTTTVNNGALVINGTNAGTGTVNVLNGGTLLGNGTTPTGLLTVASGGNLAPGASANTTTNSIASSAGVLKVGALTLSSGSNLNIYLSENNDPTSTGTGAGTAYSQVSSSGAVTLTGSKLNLNLGSGLTVGDKFFILDNTSANATTGTFSNISGTSFTQGGETFTINYADNGDGGAMGNDISLTVTAVPEPSTWVAGILSLCILGFSQRRRLRDFRTALSRLS